MYHVTTEDSYLLTLYYSETGPVEIAVTFSSAVCNKTTTLVRLYMFLSCGVCVCVPLSLLIYSAVEGVLTSVYLTSRTLVIESRDSYTASPENYAIIIATPTKVVNMATVEYNVVEVSPGSKVG